MDFKTYPVHQVMVVPEYPPCDRQDCQKPAQFTCVWLERKYLCREHMARIQAIAGVLGFPTPYVTLARLVLPDEEPKL